MQHLIFLNHKQLFIYSNKLYMHFIFNKRYIDLNILQYKKEYMLKCHKIIYQYWHYLICY